MAVQVVHEVDSKKPFTLTNCFLEFSQISVSLFDYSFFMQSLYRDFEMKPSVLQLAPPIEMDSKNDGGWCGPAGPAKRSMTFVLMVTVYNRKTTGR